MYNCTYWQIFWGFVTSYLSEGLATFYAALHSKDGGVNPCCSAMKIYHQRNQCDKELYDTELVWGDFKFCLTCVCVHFGEKIFVMQTVKKGL